MLQGPFRPGNGFSPQRPWKNRCGTGRRNKPRPCKGKTRVHDWWKPYRRCVQANDCAAARVAHNPMDFPAIGIRSGPLLCPYSGQRAASGFRVKRPRETRGHGATLIASWTQPVRCVLLVHRATPPHSPLAGFSWQVTMSCPFLVPCCLMPRCNAEPGFVQHLAPVGPAFRCSRAHSLGLIYMSAQTPAYPVHGASGSPLRMPRAVSQPLSHGPWRALLRPGTVTVVLHVCMCTCVYKSPLFHGETP